jgi:hypothetical protein
LEVCSNFFDHAKSEVADCPDRLDRKFLVRRSQLQERRRCRGFWLCQFATASTLTPSCSAGWLG